jgi:tRNA(adenine34) deaminase
MQLSEHDHACFERAIQLARQAERAGNLPIGAVLSLHGEVIGEGANAIWTPSFNPNRHAEIEALRSVPEELWRSSRKMILYTTLEPCLMCLGAILLHRVGRVMYGAADHYGGASLVMEQMPTYFERAAAQTEWIGPAYLNACGGLFTRVMQLVENRHAGEL